MSRVWTIQIRLTRDQYERIRNNSQIKGFGSMSSYLRFLALDQDFILQKKIFEIHAHLLGSDGNGKFKKNLSAHPT